jgi:mannosyltransferase OCH1-like enzyme
VHDTYPEMWPLYRRYPEQIQRVDAARYMLLHHFGGVYADLDIECLRPFDTLREHRVVLPVTAPAGFSNDLMMSEPGHPLFATLIEHLERSLARWGRWYVPRHFRVLLTTGSLHLSLVTKQSPERADVYALPPELYSSQDRDHAYVYHWPGNTWAGWDTKLITGVYYRGKREAGRGKRDLL